MQLCECVKTIQFAFMVLSQELGKDQVILLSSCRKSGISDFERICHQYRLSEKDG